MQQEGPISSSEMLLSNPALCKTLRCCLSFSHVTDPQALAQVVGESLDLILDQLKILQNCKVLLLNEQAGVSRWQVELPQEDLQKVCKIAEQSYIEGHASRKVDIQGRLEWLEDAYQMIQNAKRSLGETVSKS